MGDTYERLDEMNIGKGMKTTCPNGNIATSVCGADQDN